MKVPQNALRLGANTSTADINAFMNRAGADPNQKIIAKEKNGVTYLFMKSDIKKHALSDLAGFVGMHDKRKEAARSGLNQLLDSLETKLSGDLKGADLSNVFKTLRGDIAKSDGRSMNGKELNSILSSISRYTALEELVQTKGLQSTTSTKFEATLEKSLVATADKVTTKIDNEGADVDLPNINLPGGESYKPVKHIANGGFGAIYLYENTKDPNDKITLKTPLPGTNPGEFGKMDEEILRHAAIGGGSNKDPNVLEMKGGVRLPDGSPGLIMEYCPHGSLDDIAKTMRMMVGDGPGKLPPELADALSGSLLQGVGKGVEHVHGKNVALCDLKAPNVLLNAQGRPVLSDLAEAQNKKDVKGPVLSNANPNYISPELHTSKANAKSIVSPIENRAEGMHRAVDRIVQQLSRSGVDTTQLESELKNLINEDTKQKLGQALAGHTDTFDPIANDNWGFGMIAVRLYTGKELMDIHGDPIDMLANLGRMNDGNAVQKPGRDGKLPGDALVPSTRNQTTDSLLNGLLTKDQTTRLDPKSVQNHKAIDQPGVGGQPLFDLVGHIGKMKDVYAELDKKDGDIKQLKHHLAHMLTSPKGHEAAIKNYRGQLAQMNQDRAAIEKKLQPFIADFEEAKTKALDYMKQANAKVSTATSPSPTDTLAVTDTKVSDTKVSDEKKTATTSDVGTDAGTVSGKRDHASILQNLDAELKRLDDLEAYIMSGGTNPINKSDV